MRIALLSYEFPPDTGFGGIGTYTWYQARAMAKLGHEVHVVAGSTRPGIHRSEVDGVQVTRVAERAFLHGAVEGMLAEGLGWAPNRIQTAAGAYLVVRDLLEQGDIDMVEYPECGADGMIVTTLLPVRTCVRFHSPARLIMESYGANEIDTDAASFLEQVSINQADLRFASSSFLAAEAVTRLAVPPPVHVVPNGIDLELFDRDEGIDVVERFGLPRRGDAVTVFFSSRLERRKGVHLLEEICTRILSEYPHVHFAFAGEDVIGTYANEIAPAAEAAGFGDRVHHLGRLPLPEVRAILKHIDIHLLPTLWDNAPYAVIEAMAAGRAILSADCGGLPELVRHGETGLLATTDDAGSFVDALRNLVEDPDLRERLGADARRAIEEQYDDKALARRTVDLYRGTITGTA